MDYQPQNKNDFKETSKKHIKLKLAPMTLNKLNFKGKVKLSYGPFRQSIKETLKTLVAMKIMFGQWAKNHSGFQE